MSTTLTRSYRSVLREINKSVSSSPRSLLESHVPLFFPLLLSLPMTEPYLNTTGNPTPTKTKPSNQAHAPRLVREGGADRWRREDDG